MDDVKRNFLIDYAVQTHAWNSDTVSMYLRGYDEVGHNLKALGASMYRVLGEGLALYHAKHTIPLWRDLAPQARAHLIEQVEKAAAGEREPRKRYLDELVTLGATLETLANLFEQFPAPPVGEIGNLARPSSLAG
jgi:hypothetical protein